MTPRHSRRTNGQQWQIDKIVLGGGAYRASAEGAGGEAPQKLVY